VSRILRYSAEQSEAVAQDAFPRYLSVAVCGEGFSPSERAEARTTNQLEHEVGVTDIGFTLRLVPSSQEKGTLCPS